MVDGNKLQFRGTMIYCSSEVQMGGFKMLSADGTDNVRQASADN